MYKVINGKLVLPDGIRENMDLYIEGNRISAVVPHNILPADAEKDGPVAELDAENCYVSPGFIDIHSDYIENVLSPRPNMMMDMASSFLECDKILCGHGITTMFHSISFCENAVWELKPVRKTENAEKLVTLIRNSEKDGCFIRHKFHARLEVTSVHDEPLVRKLLEQNQVDLLSFMDHTPGQGQYRDLETARTKMQEYGKVSGRQEFQQYLESLKNEQRLSLEQLSGLTRLAEQHHLAVSSHDDDTPQKVDLVQQLGATVTEFPITEEVAAYAKSRGMYTLAGAPNVLLGGSHCGNLNAAEAIIHKNIDMLCSDYHPAALLHAVFIMAEKYKQDLGQMFNLITINPARAVRIDRDFGSIEKGKVADLVIISRRHDGIPFIKKVIVDGTIAADYTIRTGNRER